jgi:hypothetical protein
MNIEQSSGIRGRFLAMRHHLHYLRLLLWEQLRTAPSNAAFVASGLLRRTPQLTIYSLNVQNQIRY